MESNHYMARIRLTWEFRFLLGIYLFYRLYHTDNAVRREKNKHTLDVSGERGLETKAACVAVDPAVKPEGVTCTDYCW